MEHINNKQNLSALPAEQLMIGVIGGLTWESTNEYYEIINKRVQEKLGGSHSANMLVYSGDFDKIENLIKQGQWDHVGDELGKQAEILAKAGASFIVIAANTAHKVVPQIQKYIPNIPILHIADATAKEIKKDNIKNIGLLGTKYTVQEDFYTKKLADAGLNVIIPDPADIDAVHDAIYDRMCRNIFCDQDRQNFINIIDKLHQKGAEGIILGCTEIGLLIKQENVPSIPLYDTTMIHAITAANVSLGLETLDHVIGHHRLPCQPGKEVEHKI